MKIHPFVLYNYVRVEVFFYKNDVRYSIIAFYTKRAMLKLAVQQKIY